MLSKLYFTIVPKDFTDIYYIVLDEKYPKGTYSEQFREKQLSRMLDMFLIHWIQYWLIRLLSKKGNNNA